VFANSDLKGRTPVHFAAQSGHSGLLITLLRAGGSPVCPDKTGYTPLHWASYNGNFIDSSVQQHLLGPANYHITTMHSNILYNNKQELFEMCIISLEQTYCSLC